MLTLFLALGTVEESSDPDAKQLDMLGIVTLSLAVFGLTFYITQGSEFGFASRVASYVIAATAASFVAFVLVEKINPYPDV